jgi:hypothetical protein
MFRHTECYDPRDKVHAPLCLAPDDVLRYIRPDYTRKKTVLDIYTDVVRYYIEHSGHDLGLFGHSLDFLGHAMYREEETRVVETPQGVKSVLPSWVPNFSANLNIFPIPKLLHVPRGSALHEQSAVPSDKQAYVTAYFPLSGTPSRSFIEDKTLYVGGVCIDSIIDIIKNDGPDPEAARASANEKSRKWAGDLKYKYFTGEAYFDVLKRTLVLDIVYDDVGRPAERGGKIDFAFLLRPHVELSLVEYRNQMNMRTAKVRASLLRDIGLSQKFYILMIPNTAMVGDAIWALAGGHALYILRPMNLEKAQYRFIGECYAHGLMDGEITRRLHLGEVKIEDISLI